MPTVSVVIPTYNHQEHVLQTLESVFAQTFDDLEIIVINDGSPDDTAARLEPLVRSGRIRYLSQPNAGQAAARNVGLGLAAGEYIKFLDDDDLLPPDALQWQTRRLRDASRISVVAGMAANIGDTLSQSSPDETLPLPGGFENLFYGCPMASPGQALMRTDAVKRVGGFDASIWGADDYDLWFRLAQQTPLEIWKRVALLYRRHEGNASNNVARMHASSRRVIVRHLRGLPARKRFFYRRIAFRYLFDYTGKRLLTSANSSSANGILSRHLAVISCLKGFGTAAILDPQLAQRIVKELTASRT